MLATGTTGKAISATKNNLNITLTGCGFFSNSSASNTISLGGNNDTINAEHVGTVGGISTTGNSKTVVANSTTGDPPVTDPYAADAATSWVATPSSILIPPLPTPSCAGAGCPTQSCNSPAGASTPKCASPLPFGNYTKAQALPSGSWTMVAGTYNFSQGLTINSGATWPIPAGVNLIVTGNLINNGTINFNNSVINLNSDIPSIAITGGSWTGTGANHFGSGDYSIAITGGNWTPGNGSTTTFGGGNYSIAITGTVINTGDWTLGNGSTTTFGNGSYSVALTAPTGTITGSGNWTISGGTTTFGSGTYSVVIKGNGGTNTGNWTISGGINNFGTGTYSVRLTSGTVANTNNWTISGGTNTFLNGTYTVALTGTGTSTTGNWNISTNTTIGPGIYHIGELVRHCLHCDRQSCDDRPDRQQ